MGHIFSLKDVPGHLLSVLLFRSRVFVGIINQDEVIMD